MINLKALTFFDRPKIAAKVGATARKVFSRFGAFVMRRDRSSIRKRKKPSRPGQPPSSHLGLIKRFIFFAWDFLRETVVIGTVKLGGKPGDAPHALEKGGEALVARGGKGKRQRQEIEAHPHTGPAFAAELPGLPAMWKDSVH
jgi:hypothetical protein